ncbi:hypothetical protein DIPPA_16225 [Diplonema papillatum]|nr:hypothetical protein DIPPA_16225 [Diplonema papillatum]
MASAGLVELDIDSPGPKKSLSQSLELVRSAPSSLMYGCCSSAEPGFRLSIAPTPPPFLLPA